MGKGLRYFMHLSNAIGFTDDAAFREVGLPTSVSGGTS